MLLYWLGMGWDQMFTVNPLRRQVQDSAKAARLKYATDLVSPGEAPHANGSSGLSVRVDLQWTYGWSNGSVNGWFYESRVGGGSGAKSLSPEQYTDLKSIHKSTHVNGNVLKPEVTVWSFSLFKYTHESCPCKQVCMEESLLANVWIGPGCACGRRPVPFGILHCIRRSFHQFMRYSLIATYSNLPSNRALRSLKWKGGGRADAPAWNTTRGRYHIRT